MSITTEFKGYELSRAWFDFCFDNKEAKPIHTALYLWITELANRMGWKKEFGLPSASTMELLSIGNKNTYLNALHDIERWGFIKIISESKNQYQACRISLCRINNDTALYTPLDTAMIQHDIRHCNSVDTSTDTSVDTIDKQLNNETIKQLNKEGDTPPIPLDKEKKNKAVLDFSFLDTPENLPFKDVFRKFYQYRVKEKKKGFKLQSTLETSFNHLKNLSSGDPQAADLIVTTCIANGWQGLQPIKNEFSRKTESNAGGTIQPGWTNPATTDRKLETGSRRVNSDTGRGGYKPQIVIHGLSPKSDSNTE